MKAEQAREIANRSTNPEYDQVMAIIHEEAAIKKMCTHVKCDLSIETRLKLIEDGYTVDQPTFGPGIGKQDPLTKISWEK